MCIKSELKKIFYQNKKVMTIGYLNIWILISKMIHSKRVQRVL